MSNLIKKFFKEEEGSVIEYIIVLAVVAVIIMLLFPSLRKNLDSWYHNMMCNVQKGLGSDATVKQTATTGGATGAASTDCNYTTTQTTNAAQ